MFKKFLDATYKYKKKLSKFKLIALYFQFRILFSNIKNEFFKSDVITPNDVMMIGKVLEVSSSMLGFDKKELGPPSIETYDTSVVLEIVCDPVTIVLTSSNISFRYEIYIKDYTGSRETHIDRQLTNINLDRQSDYGNDHDVYDMVSNYVDALIDDIRDYWLDSIVERIFHEK